MSDHAPSRERRGRSTPGRGAARNEAKGPIHWSTLSPLDAQREWPALRAWVDDLRERYPEDLDHHVIPSSCWFAHESHVVALQALKDHERVAYDPDSPASSAVDWHRALRDVVALLRTCTSNLRCTATEHFPARPVPAIDEAAFAKVVADDVARRRRKAIDRALGDSGADRASGAGYEV